MYQVQGVGVVGAGDIGLVGGKLGVVTLDLTTLDNCRQL